MFVCKDGKLLPRDPQKFNRTQPRTISYTHMVRKLNIGSCDCKEQIETLKKQFQIMRNQKDNQIRALINRIAQKQTENQVLQRSIQEYKSHQTPKKNIFQDLTNYENYDQNWQKMSQSLNSTTISHFSILDCSGSQNYKSQKKNSIKKTELQIQECFNKTNNLMNQIQGLMKKKKKYEFHNKFDIQSSIIEQLQNSQQKCQQNTRDILMQEGFSLPEQQYNTQEDNSLDMTNYESVKNYGFNTQSQEGFIEKILNDTVNLKNTIYQMKQESNKQISQLEKYYQQQLKISFQQLLKQKQKNRILEKEMMNRSQFIKIQQKQNSKKFIWDVGQHQKIYLQE